MSYSLHNTLHGLGHWLGHDHGWLVLLVVALVLSALWVWIRH